MRKNYRNVVLDNVENNYTTYKEAELNKLPIEIFDDAYQIHFYETMRDFFNYTNNLGKGIYALLARDENYILDRLYNHYMRDWESTVSTDEQIEDFINDYYYTNSERGSEM